MSYLTFESTAKQLKVTNEILFHSSASIIRSYLVCEKEKPVYLNGKCFKMHQKRFG